MPYCKDAEGKGPAWANSLFEDNAEFGLGMVMANKKVRGNLEARMNEAMDAVSPQLAAAFKEWIAAKDCAKGSKEAADKIAALISDADQSNPAIKEIADRTDYLVKRSQWVFGGDGWAYDIGYGGLDHVLASGENVNVMVFDTEVYSTPAASPLNPLRRRLLPNLLPAAKRLRKKTWA